MQFVLNKEKAAQAAAYLIALNGGTLDLFVLMKLIYLADREALIKSGAPITGATMVSMDHGPTPSEVYDATKPEYSGRRPWCNYISERHGNNLTLIVKEPANDELSRFELKILRAVFEEHGPGNKTWAQLYKDVHALPEYIDPHGSSVVIDPSAILRNAGKSQEEIDEISNRLEALAFLKSLQAA